MSWFKDILYEVVMKGGTLAKKGTGEKRIKKCHNLNGQVCKYVGIVHPLPLISDEGCLKCGCPFKTKPFMETYFDLETLKQEKITCPHEDGDMWQDL